MMEETFIGFEPSNTTPVPDILFDQLMTDLSNAELRVLLYIIRRTWGFKKETDPISYNQFLNGITTKDGRILDKGCGVTSRSTLSTALKGLEESGYIVTTKGKDPLGDNQTTLYSIRFRSRTSVNQPHKQASGGSPKTVPPVVPKSNQGSPKTVPPVVPKSNQQETVRQETVIQQTEVQESTSVVANPTSPNASPTDMPTLSLLESLNEVERAFWELWCSRDCFKIRPKLTEIALGHVRELAPHVTTSEQLEQLVEYSRQKLLKRNKDGVVQLGNLKADLNGWLQTQTSTSQDASKSVKPLDKMSREELIAHALSFPTRMDHHTQEYKDLQNCLNRLNPDDKAQVLRKRIGMQNQKVKEEQEKADPLVLWTRTPQDMPAIEQFKHTRRGQVDQWEALRDSITWEYIPESEALKYGWEEGRVFSDRETRELFAAKERLSEMQAV